MKSWSRLPLAVLRENGRRGPYCWSALLADARALAEQLGAGFSNDERVALAGDPMSAIPELAPLTVNVRRRDVARSQCSVEGLYLEEQGLIEVMPAMSARRTKFTTLHEFGHHLARNTRETARELAAAHAISEVHSKRLEERIADAFAAELLVPTADVVALLDGHQPIAEHVRDLFELVEGSREACCIRMAQHMLANGYIILAEERTVRFCAVVGDAYSVRRGTIQDEHHLLAAAFANGYAQRDHVRMRHASGIQTREYGGQAVLTDDGYTFAVLTDATRLPWGGWRTPGDEGPAGIDMECDGCGEEVEAWKRCPACTGPICPHCSWCACSAPRPPRVATQRCTACQQMKRIDLFDGGKVCVDCR
jgi:IrrE N-terminal-like domain